MQKNSKIIGIKAHHDYMYVFLADSKATNKPADEDGSSVHGSSSVASGSVDGTKHRKKRKKDFIKRNKEVQKASDSEKRNGGECACFITSVSQNKCHGII